MSIASQTRFAGIIREKIVPIRPFLDLRANWDAKLKENLEIMDARKTFPNTPAWCDRKGTDSPIVLSNPIKGRFIFADYELHDHIMSGAADDDTDNSVELTDDDLA